jgi:TolB-like protein
LKNNLPAILLCALWLAQAGPASGQSAAPLLEVPGHPRAIALGCAFTAVAADASAAWWNPAGLEGVLETDIFFMHQSWFSDSDIEFLAAARRLPFGTAALSLAYLHMPPFEINDASGQASHTANVYDVAVLLGFASRIGAFPVGLTVKSLFRDLDGDTASLLAVDLGVSREFAFLRFFKSHLPNSSLSLVARNLSTPLYFKGSSVPIPAEFVLGFRCVPLKAKKHYLLLTCDASLQAGRFGGSPVWAAGVEYGLLRSLFLRCGLNIQDTVRPSAGAGFSFDLGGLNLDFDVSLFRKNGQNVYSTSLGVRSSMNRTQKVYPARTEDLPAGPSSRDGRQDRTVVGFAPFVNLTRKPEYDYLCDTIPESVQTIISRNTNILLIDRRKTGSILPADGAQTGNYPVLFEKAGIVQVVTGSFVESQRMISVNLKVIDTRSSEVVFGSTVNGTAGKGLFKLIDSVSAELNGFFSSRQPVNP